MNNEEIIEAIDHKPTIANVILQGVTVVISAGVILIRPKVTKDVVIQTGENDVIVTGNIFLEGENG